MQIRGIEERDKKKEFFRLFFSFFGPKFHHLSLGRVYGEHIVFSTLPGIHFCLLSECSLLRLTFFIHIYSIVIFISQGIITGKESE